MTPAAYDSVGPLLPRVLAGTEVLLDGEALPLLFASNSQINVMTPPDLAVGRRMTLAIRVDGKIAASRSFIGVAAQPSLFLSPTGSCGYPTLAALLESGGQVSCGNPAPPGSIVSLFLNGIGPGGGQTIGEVNNRAGIVLPVALEARGGEIEFAGPALGQPAGIWQVNLRLPGGAGAGLRTIELLINGQTLVAGSLWVRGTADPAAMP